MLVSAWAAGLMSRRMLQVSVSASGPNYVDVCVLTGVHAVDIVLTDDNFASIIAAIKEGRRSFDNIKSFALHLLAGNVGQAIVLMVGLAFKDHQNLSVFPLSPGE